MYDVKKVYELEAIFKKGTAYARSRRTMLETHQEPEDFGSYCVERKLKETYSRLFWMFADYLRKGSGSKRSNGYDTRKSLGRPASLNVSRGGEGSEWIESIPSRYREFDLETRQELEHFARFIRTQNQRDKKIIELFLAGNSFVEIGKIFSISASKVSQIFRKNISKARLYMGITENDIVLSKAEQEVYNFKIKGMSNKTIADKLFVSEKTIKFHCTNIFKKKGVSRGPELIALHFDNTDIITKNSIEEINKMKDINHTLPMKTNQYNEMQKESHKESINFIHDKFGVGQTVDQLQHMMKEVTKEGINANNVNAACNCVARLNETIDTAIKAARFLKNG